MPLTQCGYRVEKNIKPIATTYLPTLLVDHFTVQVIVPSASRAAQLEWHGLRMQYWRYPNVLYVVNAIKTSRLDMERHMVEPLLMTMHEVEDVVLLVLQYCWLPCQLRQFGYYRHKYGSSKKRSNHSAVSPASPREWYRRQQERQLGVQAERRTTRQQEMVEWFGLEF